jgi:guanylate kinase
MKKRIIIVGKGGSGKDHLRKELEKVGFRYCVSHTTRPPRDGEIDGEDYYFISIDSAAHEFIGKGKFYEHVIFNEWVYGTSIDEFLKSNLFIMTPSGLSKMKEIDRKESVVVYLDIDEDIRRERLSKRNDADKIERRLEADKKDFNSFTDFDYAIFDPFFSAKDPIFDLNRYKND